MTTQQVSKIDTYDTGAFKRIDKDRLNIDPEYQREVNNPLVNKIKSDWQWPACGAISVAKREDGTFRILDGQHRWMAALQIKEITQLPCMIFQMSGQKAEANQFVQANSVRKSLRARDKYNAKLITGDELALRISPLIHQATDRGVRIGNCHGVIEDLAKSNMEALKNVWPAMLDICQSGSMPTNILRGLVYLEMKLMANSSRFPHTLKSDYWRERLLHIGKANLDNAAKKAAGRFGKNSAPNWARGIVEELNKGLKVNRLYIFED